MKHSSGYGQMPMRHPASLMGATGPAPKSWQTPPPSSRARLAAAIADAPPRSHELAVLGLYLDQSRRLHGPCSATAALSH